MNGINSVNFEIGYDCNGCCDYCFQNYAKQFSDVADIQKSVDIIKKIYNDGKAEPDFSIMIFGGESLLYKDWIEEFVKEIRKCEFPCPIRITTNGTLLNKENLDFLISLNVVPTISIDGGFLTQEEHRHFISDVIYTNVLLAIKEFHLHNMDPLCQSTFTPYTIGKAFESYLFISALGFKRWWYELESVSSISNGKWNKTSYLIYRNQINQILRIKAINPQMPEIEDLTQIIKNFDKKTQSSRIIVNPAGEVHFSSLGILQIPPSQKEKMLVGNYTNIDYKKIKNLQIYGSSPTSLIKKECENCSLHQYCILDDGDLGRIQDSSNCFWWKILWEEYNGIK